MFALTFRLESALGLVALRLGKEVAHPKDTMSSKFAKIECKVCGNRFEPVLTSFARECCKATVIEAGGKQVFAMKVPPEANVARVIRPKDDGPASGYDEVLVLANKESVGKLMEPGDGPMLEMAVEYDHTRGKFVWEGCAEKGFDPGAEMMTALKEGVLKKVKKFKMVEGGPWLYDIEPMPEFGEEFNQRILNAMGGIEILNAMGRIEMELGKGKGKGSSSSSGR